MIKTGNEKFYKNNLFLFEPILKKIYTIIKILNPKTQDLNKNHKRALNIVWIITTN
jgi:hypothetical protein